MLLRYLICLSSTSSDRTPLAWSSLNALGEAAFLSSARHAWRAGMRGGEGFEQELFGRCRISCRTEEEIERISFRINRSVEVHPLLFDFDRGFIDTPRVVGGFEVRSATFLHLGRVALNPAIDGRMIDVQSSLHHHLLKTRGSSANSEDTNAHTAE